MTKSEFRATSPEDAGKVTELLQRVFSSKPGACVIEPRHLHWKNWEERSDWPGSRGYVVARGEDLIAHGTVLPLSCVTDGRRLRMVHVIDWVADPKVVGAGVSHMRKFTTMVDGILAVGGSDMAEKALPAMGFRSCGTIQRFALPLHPLQRLSGQKPGARLLLQFGRSVLWAWQARGSRGPGWTARRIPAEQVRSSNIPMPKPVPGMAIFERTPEMLLWLLKCPAVPVELYAVSRSGSAAAGYFLLSHAPGQVRLADFWIDSSRPEDWQALLQLAVSEARKDRDAAEIVTLASDEWIRQNLTAVGFHDRGSYNIRVLPAKGVEFPAVPIRCHMIDYDMMWLHEHEKNFWA